MTEIKVGDILYKEEWHRNEPATIKEVKVAKVGRTFFYLEGYLERYQVRKEDLTHENKVYSQANFTLYRTKEEIEQKNLRRDLWADIRQKVSSTYNSEQFALEEIQQIANILRVKL